MEADALLGGAIKFQGEMLDPPMFGKALQTLLRAHALHALSEEDTRLRHGRAAHCRRRSSGKTGRTESSCERRRAWRSTIQQPFPRHYENRGWTLPEFFNIGVACTDAHLGTPAADRVAMIVEDDALGTSATTYRELAARTSRFAQLLRDLGIGGGRAGADPPAQLPSTIPPPSSAR